MSDDAAVRPRLTARQQEWLSHLEAWRSRGGTLKAYALEHGLSPGALYNARRALEQRGAWRARPSRKRHRASPPKLLPVRMRTVAPTSSGAMLRVMLPSGVVFEIAEHADPVRCRELLAGVWQALR
jgi:hypothetical protein